MNHYEEIAEFYDDIAKDYCDYRKATSVLKNLVVGKDILDVGAGTGYISIWLSQQEYNVTAVDSSEPMLQIAKKKKDKLGLNVKLVKQDLKELDLHQRFDTIIMYESVFCIFRKQGGYFIESYILNREDVKKSLKKMYDHLKDGGLLLIDVRDLRDESMKINLRNGNSYKTKVEKVEKNKLKISHIIEKDHKIIAESIIEKLIIGFDEFKQLIEEANFKIIGFDKTGQIFLILKKD